MRKVWGAGGGRLRWQVGKAGSVVVRDARATGGEAGEKADCQAGEARGWAAGMGRDGRGGTEIGFTNDETNRKEAILRIGSFPLSGTWRRWRASRVARVEEGRRQREDEAVRSDQR